MTLRFKGRMINKTNKIDWTNLVDIYLLKKKKGKKN